MAADVVAPLSGHIWEIIVAPGDAVEEGDMVLIIEALKMETPVEATATGRVKEIHVQESDAVEEGEVLLSIETD